MRLQQESIQLDGIADTHCGDATSFQQLDPTGGLFLLDEGDSARFSSFCDEKLRVEPFVPHYAVELRSFVNGHSINSMAKLFARFGNISKPPDPDTHSLAETELVLKRAANLRMDSAKFFSQVLKVGEQLREVVGNWLAHFQAAQNNDVFLVSGGWTGQTIQGSVLHTVGKKGPAINDTYCGDDTFSQSASRANKSSDEAFTLRLREELLPAAQLGGIDGTHCGDTTSQIASRAKKTCEGALKMKPQNGFIPAAQLGSFDATVCGEATPLLFASRAMQRGVKAFTTKLHQEAISSTSQLGGINDTKCGDATFSHSASRATESREEACSLKLRNKCFDYTHCGDATLLQSASRANKSSEEAFTLKLREELIPAARLGGLTFRDNADFQRR